MMLIHRQPYEIDEDYSCTPVLCGQDTMRWRVTFNKRVSFSDKEVTCPKCLKLIPAYQKERKRRWKEQIDNWNRVQREFYSGRSLI